MQSLDLKKQPIQGTSLIEASAGTGKTYSIAALYLHFVLAGLKPEQILVVTFTEAATKELKDRLRQRLFAASLNPEQGEDKDIIALYPEAGKRLRQALLDIDRAAIFTIHGFCQRVLSNYAFECDSPFGAELLTDATSFDNELIQAWLRRKLYHQPDEPLSSAELLPQLKSLLQLHRQQGSLPVIERLPSDKKILQEFASELGELERQAKERLAVLTFDDLIGRLHQALHGGAQAQALTSALRRDYRAVLVDEFQDTDRRQFEIFDSVFGHDPSCFFAMIGDPTQSIYGFRGADIDAYLKAGQTAGDNRFGLAQNFRSEKLFGERLNDLYAASADAFLLHQRIQYQPIQYAEAAKRSGFLRDPQKLLQGQSLQFLQVDGGNKEQCSRNVVRQTATQIAALLRGGLKFELKGVMRDVAPQDFAVLVRKHDEARQIQSALRRHGIKAITGKSGSLYASREAQEVLWLLEAVLEPASSQLRRALASRFFGLGAEELAGLDDGQLASRLDTFRLARQRWDHRGIFAMLSRLAEEQGFARRLAAQPQGERCFTNFHHLAEVLHQYEGQRRASPEEIVHFLHDKIKDPGTDDEDTQRLESDEDAVRILTVHASKGLEFPIVFAPFFWYPKINGSYSKPKAGVYRLVGKDGQEHFRYLLPEQMKTYAPKSQKPTTDEAVLQRELIIREDARLLYVALTRAANACFVALPEYNSVQWSPLANHFAVANYDDLLTSLASAGFPLYAPLEPAANHSAADAKSELGAPIPLPFPDTRDIPLAARLLSFSALTRGVEHAAPERPANKDEDADDEAPLTPAALRERLQDAWGICGFRACRRAADYGTAIHAAFELADFSRPESWRPALAKALRSNSFPGESGEPQLDLHFPLVDNTLNTRFALPGGAPEFRLAEISLRDRVAEMEFHFTLREPPPAALRDFFRRRGGVFAEYAQILPEFSPGQLRGLMNGKADLIFRHQERYYILDWKTNDIAKHLVDDIATAASREMLASHYILQYHIYAAALHLHLKQCLGNAYDPSRHCGGVIYPFVRYGQHPAAFYTDLIPAAELEAFASLLH